MRFESFWTRMNILLPLVRWIIKSNRIDQLQRSRQCSFLSTRLQCFSFLRLEQQLDERIRFAHCYQNKTTNWRLNMIAPSIHFVLLCLCENVFVFSFFNFVVVVVVAGISCFVALIAVIHWEHATLPRLWLSNQPKHIHIHIHTHTHTINADRLTYDSFVSNIHTHTHSAPI